MKHLQTVEDFISDDYFQRWVLEKDQEAEAYWKQWIAHHPQVKPVIEEARQISVSLNFKEDFPEEERFHQVWHSIQTQNQAYVDVYPLKKESSIHHTGWKIAAVISLLLAAGITFWTLWQSVPEYVTYTTGYGQTQQLVLPDSSVVMLNANSTLRYPASWHDDGREVWLEGEAFFQVAKKQVRGDTFHPAKFLVHTNQLEVEVLGTAFNVNTRREKTQVVLNHGRVNINFENKNEQKNLVMQPGDMVEYMSPERMITHAQVDTVVYTSWVAEKLIFKDQTLEEIAFVLEDNFGYQIIFSNSHIAQEKFTASIPTEDVNLLFPMLSRAFDLSIERKQQQIIFSNK